MMIIQNILPQILEDSKAKGQQYSTWLSETNLSEGREIIGHGCWCIQKENDRKGIGSSWEN